jgi:hypothetical protein
VAIRFVLEFLFVLGLGTAWCSQLGEGVVLLYAGIAVVGCGLIGFSVLPKRDPVGDNRLPCNHLISSK